MSCACSSPCSPHRTWVRRRDSPKDHRLTLPRRFAWQLPSCHRDLTDTPSCELSSTPPFIFCSAFLTNLNGAHAHACTHTHTDKGFPPHPAQENGKAQWLRDPGVELFCSCSRHDLKMCTSLQGKACAGPGRLAKIGPNAAEKCKRLYCSLRSWMGSEVWLQHLRMLQTSGRGEACRESRLSSPQPKTSNHGSKSCQIDTGSCGYSTQLTALGMKCRKQAHPEP